MVDQPNVFETPKPEDNQPPADPAPQGNVFADQLSMIKNPDGAQKYDSVPKALEALAHSQTHIATLEQERIAERQELDRLKTELSSRESVEDVVQRLYEQPPKEPAVTPDPSQAFDPSQVNDLVQQALVAQQTAAQSEQNKNNVSSQLTAKFGEKTNEVVGHKLSELGMSMDQLANLSSASPQAALALFNQTAPQSSEATSTSFNSSAIPKIEPEGVKRPEKSILIGARGDTQKDHWLEHKRSVYGKLGVEE